MNPGVLTPSVSTVAIQGERKVILMSICPDSLMKRAMSFRTIAAREEGGVRMAGENALGRKAMNVD